MNIQARIDVLQVLLDRPGCHYQAGGDFLIGVASGDQGEHVDLALTQSLEWADEWGMLRLLMSCAVGGQKLFKEPDAVGGIWCEKAGFDRAQASIGAPDIVELAMERGVRPLVDEQCGECIVVGKRLRERNRRFRIDLRLLVFSLETCKLRLDHEQEKLLRWPVWSLVCQEQIQTGVKIAASLFCVILPACIESAHKQRDRQAARLIVALLALDCRNELLTCSEIAEQVRDMHKTDQRLPHPGQRVGKMQRRLPDAPPLLRLALNEEQTAKSAKKGRQLLLLT